MKSRIYISNKLEHRFLALDDILYMAAVSGRIMVHYETNGKEGIIDFEGSLRELESRLKKEGFLRIHKSYTVNIRRIATVENSTVTLDSKRHIRLPASRGFSRDLKDMLAGQPGFIVL